METAYFICGFTSYENPHNPEKNYVITAAKTLPKVIQNIIDDYGQDIDNITIDSIEEGKTLSLPLEIYQAFLSEIYPPTSAVTIYENGGMLS